MKSKTITVEIVPDPRFTHTLHRLRKLDPELADWWIKRRREAWEEVGLTRPTDWDDLRHEGTRSSRVVKGAWGEFVDGLKRVALALPALRICGLCGRYAEGHAAIDDTPYCHPDHGPSCYVKAQIDAVLQERDWLKEARK